MWGGKGPSFLGCGLHSKGLLRNSTACHCVLTAVHSCAEDPAAQKIRSLRSKQEIGERTRGKLMFRARIHIVFWCVCKPRKGCVYVHSSCEVVSFKTGKKHTCIHTEKHTHTHKLTYRLLLSLYLCASGGAV